MPSDTPTTEAGRSLVDHYRRGLTFPMEWTEMLVRVRGIEAEAVRSFAERVRDNLRAAVEKQQTKFRDRGNTGAAAGLSSVYPLIDAEVRALLQAETPDASDSGEGGMREYGSLHDDHADVVEDCAECWQDADDKGSPPKPATREPRP
jgi:hypothetical protein